MTAQGLKEKVATKNSVDVHLYAPRFEWSSLHPKYWGTWLAIFFAILLAFVPPRWRDRLARKVSAFLVNKNSSMVRRARINLEHCFPEKTLQEREKIVGETFAKATQYLLGYLEFVVRSTKHNQERGVIIGEENLIPLLDSGEKVIILAPHAWAVDYPAVMLASRGYKVATIIKPQRNPVGNWLIHVQRMQYGGRIFTRDAGVKPFIRSVKDGYIGYWPADEDYGEKNSVFVPFFATEKATLRGFGKMARISKAKVIPVFTAYNDQTSKYEVHVLPAIENFPTGDEGKDARLMNRAIEELLKSRLEHYMWNLFLLKTQRDGKKIYSP